MTGLIYSDSVNSLLMESSGFSWEHKTHWLLNLVIWGPIPPVTALKCGAVDV